MSTGQQDLTEHDYAAVEQELLGRWPEHRIAPTLERVAALVDLMGEPQRAAPVVHLTGTNGKTSTARMVDTLLRAFGLRTGRFTSPHVESMRERITLDGEPVDAGRFVATYREVAPYVDLVDRDHENPLSFFEIMTGMAFAAFADAPVDAQVLEVGLGGRWDSTNVADAKVAVITPVAVDHARYLGSTPVEIAAEKAGIMKPSSIAVLAQQDPDVAEVLLRRSVELGVTVAREGFEFGVTEREVAVGGQMLGLHGLRGDYDQVFLPLHGAHQAHNAACALAAVEAFVAGLGAQEETLDPELVREGFAQVTSPGRLELVRRSPAVVVDAAHNPHGAEATAQAVGEAFAFSPLIGVLAVMEDKDALGLLEAFEPVLDRVVITRNATPRAMAVEELAEIAREVFGEDRVETALRLDDAIDLACRLAESESSALGSGGVLVSGSVVTAGEARKLLGAG